MRQDEKPPDFKSLEATPGIEPGYTALQAAASPLRHVADFQKGRRYVAQTGRLCKRFSSGDCAVNICRLYNDNCIRLAGTVYKQHIRLSES